MADDVVWFVQGYSDGVSEPAGAEHEIVLAAQDGPFYESVDGQRVDLRPTSGPRNTASATRRPVRLTRRLTWRSERARGRATDTRG